MAAPRRTARDERRRHLSQNFLHPDRAELLVESADLRAGELVLEIGAGSGVITSALARREVDVVALEVDPVCALKLAGVVAAARMSRVRVVRADVLTYPLPKRPFRIIGSLPFGRTTAILRRLLDDPRTPLQRGDLIVQWEVAKKRAGIPSLTLLGTAWAPWWEFRLEDRIPATAFKPVPRVDGCHLVVGRRDQALLPPEMAMAYGEFVRTWWSRERDTAVEAGGRRIRRRL